jgi:hypothetical protein
VRASRETLTESVIEYEERRLIFSKSLVVHIRDEKGRITLESSIGISGSGSAFQSARKNFRIEIFRRWNDPVTRAKQFLPGTVDREETVKSAVGFKEAADHETVREVA